jgi:hypothetical protein
MPDEASLRGRLERWLESAGIDEPGRIAARQAWDSTSAAAGGDERAEHAPVDRLDRVIATIGAADPRVATLARIVPPVPLKPDDLADLLARRDGDDGAFFEESVRLHAARHLVRCGLFDDAMPIMAELRAETSVDPATLLFLRATCQHWLLEADAAADTLDRLLERRDELPVRYERLATLMRRDLESLDEESLDHIARRMRDITRRLSFGRAGPVTRSVQDGVIDSLDKLIAKIEQQQCECQGQAGGAGSGSGGGSGSRPMQDSMPAGGKGPGEVTKRDMEAKDGWGDLPPHKREEALQQIGREFPPHYREAIEQYFKRLATGEGGADSRKAGTP